MRTFLVAYGSLGARRDSSQPVTGLRMTVACCPPAPPVSTLGVHHGANNLQRREQISSPGAGFLVEGSLRSSILPRVFFRSGQDSVVRTLLSGLPVPHP